MTAACAACAAIAWAAAEGFLVVLALLVADDFLVGIMMILCCVV